MPRALLAPYDKTGLAELARGLVALGWELIATGGTEKLLRDEGIPVRSVADVTGFPEILGGRVKTLHPAIHGGLLARRSDLGHLAEMEQHAIGAIDLLANNLYPFEATVAKEGVTLEDALENIDIGGPAMLRAAAKNFPDVVALCDPADYAQVLEALRAGGVTVEARRAPRREGLPARRPVRHPDRGLPARRRQGRRRLAAGADVRPAAEDEPALRRKPAPVRRPLRGSPPPAAASSG